jgi:hypothetical protein
MISEAGNLYVSTMGKFVHVVHENLEYNDKEEGYIQFTPEQARGLANLLLKHADIAESAPAEEAPGQTTST